MKRHLSQCLALVDRIRNSYLARSQASDKALGARGEDLAHRFLQKRGYTIVARNYRPPNSHREVDLIARVGRTLVIVEVKTRQSEDFLPAERSVDKEKRHNLVRAGISYVHRARIPWDFVRFDIVTVILEPHLRIRHTPDAFHPSQRERTRPVYATEMED